MFKTSLFRDRFAEFIIRFEVERQGLFSMLDGLFVVFSPRIVAFEVGSIAPASPRPVLFVNGGVKAGHWGGAKTGQFAAWASSTTRHGRPGGDGRGFVAGADVAFRRRG